MIHGGGKRSWSAIIREKVVAERDENFSLTKSWVFDNVTGNVSK